MALEIGSMPKKITKRPAKSHMIQCTSLALPAKVDMSAKIEPAALDAIAELALERKTGARGLRAIMEELLVPVMYDLPDREDIATVHITPECVTEGAEPQFSYTDEAKESA